MGICPPARCILPISEPRDEGFGDAHLHEESSTSDSATSSAEGVVAGSKDLGHSVKYCGRTSVFVYGHSTLKIPDPVPNSEVKQRCARSVLWWGTTGEYRGAVYFFFLPPLPFYHRALL